MRAKRSAGATPKATAVTTVTSAANPSTTGSNPTSSSRGMASRPRHLQHAHRDCRQQRAPADRRARQGPGSRQAAGARAGDGPSPGPSECANSWTRPVARASTRLATLTHATRSTSPTAMSSRCNGPRAVATRSSLQRNRDNGAQARGRPALLHRPAQARELGPRLLQADPASQPADGGQRVVLRIGVSPRGCTGATRPRRRRSDLRSPGAQSPPPRTARRSAEWWSR